MRFLKKTPLSTPAGLLEDGCVCLILFLSLKYSVCVSHSMIFSTVCMYDV